MVKEVHFVGLFRSASGPLSKGSPSVSDVEQEQPIASRRQSASCGAKSFTYGAGSGKTRRASNLDSSSETEEFFALLQVADITGTSPRLLQLIATVVEANTEKNELQERFTSSTVGSQHMMPTGKLTVFHGLRPPPIGIPAYLDRIAKYTKCSPACFVMALVYMDRLGQRDPDMLPTPLNVHRLLLTCVLLAAKLTDDHYFNNAFYGRVGGVSPGEMNRLELEALRCLDYRLHVPLEELRSALRQLLAGGWALGQGESWSVGLGRKRRSVSGLSASSEKRSTHSASERARRSSVDSSVGAASVSVSVTVSATPSATQSQYYDDEDDGVEAPRR